MLSGCLIDDPPPYPEPKQTPPRLDYASATPPLSQIITAHSRDVVTFTISSISEDAGDGLRAFLLLDFDGEFPSTPAGDDSMPASTLDDSSRFFQIRWRILPGTPAGCHRLTLRVSHAKNMPDSSSPPFDVADVAEAYWWLQLDPDPNSANDLVNCPKATTGTP